jgi:AcrR family transcriptional regulator
MSRRARPVKVVRTYDASRRQERARLNFQRTLDVARRRFLEHGYETTTVESIADEAGVSPATIYKTYGGKAGLIRALCQRALAGDGPVPAEQRSNALRDQDDPRVVIDGWGELAGEVAPRVIPLLLVLRDAARTDAEAAALRDELDRDRLTRMADNAQHLAAGHHLRRDVTPDHARDLMWLCSSPEVYDLLVNQRRWTVTAYSQFVASTLTGALL